MKAKLLTLLFVFGTTWSLLAVQHNVDSTLCEKYTGGIWQNYEFHKYKWDGICKTEQNALTYFWYNTLWDTVYIRWLNYNSMDNLISDSTYYFLTPFIYSIYNYSGSTLTDIVGQKWIAYLNSYRYEYRSLYHYNVTFRKDTFYLQAWDTTSSTWKFKSKTIYQYDALGNTIVDQLQVYDTSTLTYTNYSKFNYNYSASNKIATTTYYSWYSGAWDTTSRDTYSYNGADALISYLQEIWSGNTWTNYSKIVYTNNTDGQPVTQLNSNWTSGSWVNSYRYSYWYGCATYTGIEDVEADKVQLFPNPAIKTIQVSMPMLEGTTLLSVLNLQGQIVKEQPAMRGVNTIGVENLTTGTYLLKWDNNGRVQTKQFVKE